MKINRKICYLCGCYSENLTRDHVPPACLFPEPRPSNLITLPCCEDCQREYQRDEEYFRTNISSISDIENNPNARLIWDKAHRSLLRRFKLWREFTSRLFPIRIQTPSGLYVGIAPAIKIPPERTNKMLRKIAFGLFYYHTQMRVPEEFETKIFFQPKEILLNLLKKAQYRRYFENTFSYAGAVARDTKSSIWWLCFYRSVVAIVGFLAPKAG